MSSTSTLTAARYGKDQIRVFRVVRDGPVHTVVEYIVTALLEGDIETSYTHADNSVIVATDSIKNITYHLAKTSPHILVPERFALHLGAHLVASYAHIHRAFITVEQLRWARIAAGEDATPHPHAFFRDGADTRVVKAEIDGTKGKDKITGVLTAGIANLLVLKTTGSAFAGFIRDAHTTLAETPDRILSTSIDLTYTFRALPLDAAALAQGAPPVAAGGPWDERVPELARKITLDVFAHDESASVQATLFRMAQALVDAAPLVDVVTYALPNKHYVPVDMAYLGVDNTTPANAEVFVPLLAPSGLISATVTRKGV